MEGNCTFVALNGCQFTENTASAAGGAIYASYPRVFRYLCDPIETERPLKPYTDAVLESMPSLDSKEAPCKSWKGNTAGIYGSITGSPARFFNVFEKTENGTKGKEIDVSTYKVVNYESGTPLPGFEIQLVDEFQQGPASGSGNETIEARMYSNGLFVGSVIVLLEEGKGSFTGIRGYAKPKDYIVTVAFNATTLNSFSYVVTVRHCQIGEQSTDDKAICIKCTTDQYNFHPDSSCQSCPPHADCSTQFIHPQENYFHWYPCSTHLQSCLLRDGCTSKNRTTDLQSMTMNSTGCSFNESGIKSYQNVQCNEVSAKSKMCETSSSSRDTKGRFVVRVNVATVKRQTFLVGNVEKEAKFFC